MTTLTELSDIADEVIQVVNEVVNKTPQDLWEPTITAIIEIYHHHLDLAHGHIHTNNVEGGHVLVPEKLRAVSRSEALKAVEEIFENMRDDEPSA